MRRKTSVIALTIALGMGLTTTHSFAERKKMQLLEPTDGPCLFLLDDEGNETGTVANAPCDMNGTIVNPGDPITRPANANASDNRAAPAATAPTRGQGNTRDAASGMATGKRQH